MSNKIFFVLFLFLMPLLSAIGDDALARNEFYERANGIQNGISSAPSSKEIESRKKIVSGSEAPYNALSL